MRRIRKTRGMRGGGQSAPLHHQIPDEEKAPPQDVRTKTDAGLLAEEMPEAARRQTGVGRDFLERECAIQVFIDVRDRLQYPNVGD